MQFWNIAAGSRDTLRHPEHPGRERERETQREKINELDGEWAIVSGLGIASVGFEMLPGFAPRHQSYRRPIRHQLVRPGVVAAPCCQTHHARHSQFPTPTAAAR